MCGIVGYVGRDTGSTPLDVVMEGLARLEYRGYDSAGVALVTDAGIDQRKRAGKLANLRAEIANHPLAAARTGIGHTRWATHGGPTDENAHPHRGGRDGKLAVVHNGIIENFRELRAELAAEGIVPESETDTETAVHLVSKYYAFGPTAGDFVASAYAALRRLEGAFTLVFTHADHPDTIVAARRSARRSVRRARGCRLSWPVRHSPHTCPNGQLNRECQMRYSRISCRV